MDSTTYDPIGWSCLRIWEESDGAEHFHKVALRAHATAVGGETVQATAEFELQGTPTRGRLRRTGLAGSARELPGDGGRTRWRASSRGWRRSSTARPDVTAVADGSAICA